MRLRTKLIEYFRAASEFANTAYLISALELRPGKLIFTSPTIPALASFAFEGIRVIDGDESPAGIISGLECNSASVSLRADAVGSSPCAAAAAMLIVRTRRPRRTFHIGPILFETREDSFPVPENRAGIREILGQVWYANLRLWVNDRTPAERGYENITTACRLLLAHREV